jgi:hypothetical protein
LWWNRPFRATAAAAAAAAAAEHGQAMLIPIHIGCFLKNAGGGIGLALSKLHFGSIFGKKKCDNGDTSCA